MTATANRCRFCPDYATRVWYGCDVCKECFLRLVYGPGKQEPCEGCGRTAAAGCSCPSNALAIGRGERRKAEREER